MSAAGSGNLKTYGKRAGMKRKLTKELSDQQETSSNGVTSKRRKRSPVAPDSSYGGEDEIHVDAGGTPPKVKVVYGSHRQNSAPQQPPSNLSKPARDLSVIFDDIPSATSPPGSTSKLAKRMLARSKTESSIQCLPTPNSIERTPSLPNFPSPSRDSGNTAYTSKSTAPILHPGPQNTKKSITRTYAGNFRSFLVSLPADPHSTNVEDEEFDTRESYNSLRNRWGVDNSEDDPYPYTSPSPTKSVRSGLSTPDMSPTRSGKRKGKITYPPVRPPPIATGLMNPLKSISELRSKGETRRFLDEVGYLFEGMDLKGGIGLRRASALEITTKLCDPDFTRKAKVADFFTRTWDLFLNAGAGKGGDKILDILLVFFASLVARDAASLLELAQRPPSTPPSSPNPFKEKTDTDSVEDTAFASILFHILNRSTANIDLLLLSSPQSTAGDSDFKRAGINKKDRLTLTTVYKTISSKANLFSAEVPISTSLLITYTLHTLPPSMIPSNYLPFLLDSLRSTLSRTPSSSLASTLSVKWVEAAKAVQFENIYYHLLLLDTYLLDQWGTPPSSKGSESQAEIQDYKEQNDAEMDRARNNWLAEDLVALEVCVEINGMSDGSDTASLQRCLDTTLRVLVSLTHADELWGRKVVQCEYTMGWLMRLIHKTGQELCSSKTQGKLDGEVKLDETGKTTLDDQDGSPGRTDSSALDTLCLALGLLTNLVQIVKEAKDLVRNTRLNPSCSLKKRACAHSCSCSQSLSGIQVLAQLYSQQQIKTEPISASLSEDSPEAHAEADASFLRGHLSVLFGLLMMSRSENKAEILSALPTPLSYTTPENAKSLKALKQAKMTRLVEQAKDFSAFYVAVSNNLGGDKESNVAKEVVGFLETQRDLLF